MGNLVRRTFTGTTIWTPPGGVKYIKTYAVKAPPSILKNLISSGGFIDINNSVFMWGDNDYGQVGDGTTTNRSSPITVLNNVQQVLACLTTVALTYDGVIYTWGLNDEGQMGDGTVVNKSTPTIISNSSSLRFKDISASFVNGDSATFYALTSNGNLYSWGSNANSFLGFNSVLNVSVPTKVSSINFTKVTLGAGIASDGSLYCWGENPVGQVGDGTITTRSVPTAVIGGLTFKDINSWISYPLTGCRLGLTTSNVAYAWGGNSNGQIGDGTTTNRSSPTPVIGGLTFKKVIIGSSCAFGITTGDDLYAWGVNSSGQLGDGTTTSRSSPVQISGKWVNLISSRTGSAFTLAVDTNGILYAWGFNANGELGDGSTTFRSVPTAVLAAGAPKIVDTVQVNSLSVIPGTSYEINFNNYNTKLGNYIVGSNSIDYLIIEYEQ